MATKKVSVLIEARGKEQLAEAAKLLAELSKTADKRIAVAVSATGTDSVKAVKTSIDELGKTKPVDLKITQSGSGVADAKRGLAEVEATAKSTSASVKQALSDATSAFGKGFLGGVGLSEFTSVAGAANALGVALGQAAVEGVKLAASLETTFSRIKGLTNASASDIEKFKSDISSLSVTVGKSQKELAEAQYFIASSGFAGADGLNILEKSAKAAAAGLGETKRIADLTTSVLNGYGLAAGEAGRVTDVLISAVKNGKGEPEQFASALGRVIGIAAQAGVSFEELTANIATFTNVGVNVNEAVTAVRAAILNLEKPSKQATDALRSIGLTAQEVRDMVKGSGLFATLQEIYQRTGGDIDQLGRIFGNVRGLAGVLGTVGSQAEAYAKNLNAAKNATGQLDGAFAAAADTIEVKAGRLSAALDKVKIAFGNLIIPGATQALESILAVFDKIQGTTESKFSKFDIARQIADSAFAAVPPLDEFRNKYLLLGDTVEVATRKAAIEFENLKNAQISATADLSKLGKTGAEQLRVIEDAIKATTDAMRGLGQSDAAIQPFIANLIKLRDEVAKSEAEMKRLRDINEGLPPVAKEVANATQKQADAISAAQAAIRDYATALDGVSDTEAERLTRLADLQTEELKLKESVAAVKKEYKDSDITAQQYGQAMALLESNLRSNTAAQKALNNEARDAARAEAEMNRAISSGISALGQKRAALTQLQLAQEAARLALGLTTQDSYKEAAAIAAVSEAYNQKAIGLSQFVKSLSDIKLGKLNFDDLLNDPRFKNNQILLDAKAVLNLTADVKSELDTRPVRQRIADQIRGIQFDPLTVKPSVKIEPKDEVGTGVEGFRRRIADQIRGISIPPTTITVPVNVSFTQTDIASLNSLTNQVATARAQAQAKSFGVGGIQDVKINVTADTSTVAPAIEAAVGGTKALYKPQIDVSALTTLPPVDLPTVPVVDTTALAALPPVDLPTIPKVDTSALAALPPVDMPVVPVVDTSAIGTLPPVEISATITAPDTSAVTSALTAIPPATVSVLLDKLAFDAGVNAVTGASALLDALNPIVETGIDYSVFSAGANAVRAESTSIGALNPIPTIGINTAPFFAGANAVRAEVAALAALAPNVRIQTIADLSGVNAVRAAINALPDNKTVRITTVRQTVGDSTATCFASGTMIDTLTGAMPIQNVEVGFQVWAVNSRGEDVPSEVTNVYRNHTKYWVNIETEGGAAFKCTPEHPVYVLQARDYVAARQLRRGDRVRLRNGKTDEISAKIFEDVKGGPEPTFNFEVANYHNYYAEGVLVHNLSERLDAQMAQVMQSMMNLRVSGANGAYMRGVEIVRRSLQEIPVLGRIGSAVYNNQRTADNSRTVNVTVQGSGNVARDVREILSVY